MRVGPQAGDYPARNPWPELPIEADSSSPALRAPSRPQSIPGIVLPIRPTPPGVSRPPQSNPSDCPSVGWSQSVAFVLQSARESAAGSHDNARSLTDNEQSLLGSDGEIPGGGGDRRHHVPGSHYLSGAQTARGEFEDALGGSVRKHLPRY